MKKIFLNPYFGEFPEWIDKWRENFEQTLRPAGYDLLIDTDLESFKKRVKDKLGIDYPGVYGSPKVWDYRCALGLLYSEEINSYDYWGHFDQDMCYGDVAKWFPDSEISKLDVWSNHNTYVCGCWTLYANKPEVNELFKNYFDWKEKMIYPEPNGWVEQEYSRLVEQSGLKYKYSFQQGMPYTTEPNLKKENGKLYQDGVEICMFHFRRSKRWPI